MTWLWILGALVVGFTFGAGFVWMLAEGTAECAYRAGYQEGVTDMAGELPRIKKEE